MCIRDSNNISDLIFGHNKWESFTTPETETMISENYDSFHFIKKTMNKSELADAVVQLQKIAAEQTEKGAKANQLIGNLLYNTSSLGYFCLLYTSRCV